MTEPIKSPDALELKGKPKLGPRFGKKAGFIVGSVLAAAVGLVMYGIATREPADAKASETSAVNLTPATMAGKRLYEGVGDGVMGRTEAPMLASASPASPQVSGEPAAPVLAPAGQQQPAAAQGQARQPTPEELAAQRLRELREQERLKAITSPSEVRFGESATAGGTPQSEQEMRAATYQRMAAASQGGQPGAGGLPNAAMAALRGGTLGGGGNQDDPNLQVRKEGFLAAAAEQQAAESLRGTRRLAESAFELKAGTIIPTVLLTGLNSDLPGDVIGQVSENVFDSATGRHLLIPQGARVYGRYDSHVAYGQDRALVAWNRLLYPDGSSVTLQGMGGSDKAGYAGFNDQVNNHIWRLLGYGAISSAFASVFQITQRNQQQTTVNGVQSPQQVAAGEIARQYSQLGMQMAQKNLNIQPTIEIRPGYQFVVMVNRDMVFPESYRDKSAKR
ncbi:MAG: TrbI/VirB10 family protein [Pseudomonadota bacterium]|nr:TrbI/VirB10 family protein [Pseudomonadota bacterium]